METVHIRQSSRKKKSTVKTNIIIAVVVHVLMAVAGVFWAAHEGMLGAKLQNLAVFMVPKDKKADEPKKVEKVEAKKAEQPKTLQEAKAAVAAPPKFVPPTGSGVAVAAPPPAVSIPNFGDLSDLNGGGGDPIALYKQQVEAVLRTRWERPASVQDLQFVAEAEMSVDKAGKILGYEWKKGSGNEPWDASVKKALASSRAISRPPPNGFPEKFTVRFDVQPSTEPLISRAD